MFNKLERGKIKPEIIANISITTYKISRNISLKFALTEFQPILFNTNIQTTPQQMVRGVGFEPTNPYGTGYLLRS